MKSESLKIWSVSAVAAVSVAVGFAQGPARGGAGLGAPAAGRGAVAAPAMPFTPARTADGQPDMQGMYTRSGVKSTEAQPPTNPIDPSNRNPLSVSQRGDGLGPYPGVFGQVGTVLRSGGGGRGAARGGRRGGIIDPPDRVLPWKPEEDARRRQRLLDMNPPKDLSHVEFNARCALPGLFEGEDNANPWMILQPPGRVVLLYDYNHSPRIIDLQRTTHLDKKIKLFMGDSIGHWEGNTLIVDTTNFNGKIAYSREIPYLTEALHTVERFTVADANTIEYEVTIDDPNLFTKTWTVAGAFTRAADGTEPLEFACAEGSQTLVNIFGEPPGKK
ncbi:MAG TPA: hypothetical protein VFY29_04615 [Terriglobia bacterium]|nr:hypothetical protein [Terriglobia bacterium]